jgi:serine/threonine-protein kinase
MDAPKELAAGTVVATRYRVERCLGKGGMGTVYLVRHVRTEERLALKVLHEAALGNAQAIERFRREAQAPAKIDSDHVARVVDADVATELDGAPFLVMEFLRGRDLEREIASRGSLPAAEVVALLRQAARALDKAHAMGIVHRDLKPENLFLAKREDGSTCVKVVDFGIAKLRGGADQGTTTAHGAIFGTPLYMAPEQATGDNHLVGPHTDVWAIGLIAYRMLTGKDYWSFETLAELVAKVLVKPMPKPSEQARGLAPGFDGWFAKCCARSQDERYASVGGAIDALSRALGLGPLQGDVEKPASGEQGTAAARDRSEMPTASPVAAASHTAGPMTSSKETTSRAGARGRWALGTVALVFASATVGLAFWKLSPKPRVAADAIASAPSDVATSITPPGTGSAAEPAPATASVVASTSSAPSGSAETPPQTPPRRAPIKPPKMRGAPTAVVNCNPPFTLDASGEKHYKKECL